MTDRKLPARPRLDPTLAPPRARAQRELVAASLLRAPAAHRHWDERTRLEYRTRGR
jgi:hypothetical protein